jgi:hypothetical protein
MASAAITVTVEEFRRRAGVNRVREEFILRGFSSAKKLSSSSVKVGVNDLPPILARFVVRETPAAGDVWSCPIRSSQISLVAHSF